MIRSIPARMYTETHLAPQLIAVKKRRQRWLVAGAFCALAAVALAFEFKPAYRAAKGWRARQLAGQAEALTAQEKWPDAAAKAGAAYKLMPNEPAAIRAVAHLQNAGGNATAAIPFWKELEGAKAMSVADRRSYAEDLFRGGMLAEAERELNRVLGAQAPDAAALRLAARMSAARRNFAQAMDFARRAQRLEPTSKEGQLLLGLLEFDAPGSQEKEAGLQALMQVAQDRGKTGLEAIEYLARRDDLPGDAVRKLIPLLKENPVATEAQKLMALDWEMKLEPTQREALLEKKGGECKAADAEARRSFGVWLNMHREFARTLQVIPLAEALTRKDLLLVHLDALAGLKLWKEIEGILDAKGVPLDEVYAELFLARSAMELGQVSKSELHWRRAHLGAAPSPEQMWFLGSYAEKIGETREAELAYKSLTASAKTARPAYEALLRMAEKKGDTAALRGVLREMRGRWPNDTAVENDYAYLSLLGGLEVPACLKIAERLVAQAPQSLPHRTTLALAYHRMAQPARALAVYDGLAIPWERTSPAQRAVHAAVLGSNGKPDEARAEARALRAESLRPEERELIVPWLGS